MDERGESHHADEDQAPGVEEHGGSLPSYLLGLGLAVILTLASFWASTTTVVYAPAIPLLLGVLAIAQMGVHLVFFLHISSAPDQANNILALLFGVFIVGLVVFGSMVIMANLNHDPVSMDQLMRMQR